MTPEELVKEYTDKSKPFPLPALEGMYVNPRYVIHQHDLQNLIDALRNLIAERDELRKKAARMRDALESVERWWLEEEMHKHAGAPACMFSVRHAIEALKAKVK
jgi:hypothetical protein